MLLIGSELVLERLPGGLKSSAGLCILELGNHPINHVGAVHTFGLRLERFVLCGWFDVDEDLLDRFAWLAAEAVELRC